MITLKPAIKYNFYNKEIGKITSFVSI